jgi:hypothetical protein
MTPDFETHSEFERDVRFSFERQKAHETVRRDSCARGNGTAGIEPCTPFISSTRAALIAGSPTILGVIRICFLQGFASIEAGTAELRLADLQC